MTDTETILTTMIILLLLYPVTLYLYRKLTNIQLDTEYM